jgi:tetratricopeptide (TPR) repeat protein
VIPRRLSFAVYCAAAIALVIAAYASSLHNSFHFDDSHVIETNLYLRSLGNVPRFFTDAHTFSSLPQNATYRPLVTLSLAIDYARGHGDPFAFHTTQIALLLITGALLVLFFTPLFTPLMGEWLALFAATLFCVHTANTETMNLISARSELLSTIGLLLSFILYQRSAFSRRTLLYLLPLAIGALAKAPVVVFAPLLFVYAMLFEGQKWRRALRTMLPSLVVGIALLAFLSTMNAREWTSGGGARWPYLITQPFVWLHYFRLFFLPIGLTADSDWSTFAQWYDTRAVAGYAFIALLVWSIRRSARDDAGKRVAFGLIWFAVALIPTSSVFPLAEVANEHRVFFAFVGLVLVVTAWIAAWTETRSALRNVGVACAVIVLLAHAIGTHERNEVWRTEETLWADVVVKSPMNGRAWMNFGLTHMARGRYAEAKAAFDRAAVYTPKYSYLEINEGVVEGELGHPAEAERHFRNALAMNPDANAHFFFARWLVRVGRAPEALDHLKASLSQSSAAPAPRALLLRLDDARGAEAETRALLEETRSLDPSEPSIADVTLTWPSYAATFAAGLAAVQRQDWLTAAHASREALRHDPQSADAFNNLGWALSQLGFRTEAVQAYRAALTHNPEHERARNNLQLLLAAK